MRSAYEGVQARMSVPQSFIICTCRRVLPDDVGMTEQPMASPPACAPRPPVNRP